MKDKILSVIEIQDISNEVEEIRQRLNYSYYDTRQDDIDRLLDLKEIIKQSMVNKKRSHLRLI